MDRGGDTIGSLGVVSDPSPVTSSKGFRWEDYGLGPDLGFKLPESVDSGIDFSMDVS